MPKQLEKQMRGKLKANEMEMKAGKMEMEENALVRAFPFSVPA